MAFNNLHSFIVLTFALVLQVAIASRTSGQKNPCGKESAVNIGCVRSHLAARSDCTPIANGDSLDHYKPADTYCYVNNYNASLLKYDATYEGLSKSNVKSFTVDYDNDVTIIEVLHPYIHVYGPMVIYFHSPGKATLAVTTAYEDKYYNLLTTTLIPGTSSLCLSKRQTHVYHTEAPQVTFGDDNLTYYIQTNALVNKVVTAVAANMFTAVQEIMLTMSKKIADGFIGQNLCSVDEEAMFLPFVL